MEAGIDLADPISNEVTIKKKIFDKNMVVADIEITMKDNKLSAEQMLETLIQYIDNNQYKKQEMRLEHATF